MTANHTYSESEPTEKCPYCGATCNAVFVDIGVGLQQVSPFHCGDCGAIQIGPYDKETELNADEQRTGWYGPAIMSVECSCDLDTDRSEL